MIIPFKELPDEAGGWPRPVVELVLADVEDARVVCLLDSGSLHTLVPGWMAAVAGISLADTETRTLGVGGTTTTARFVTTVLGLGDHRWEAEVGFCDPWPYAWGIAGQLAFLRYFTVVLRTADAQFELDFIST